MPADQAFLDSLARRPLDGEIDISRFACHPNVVWFLHNRARQFQELRLSQVMCWVLGNELIGFVTTSMSSLGFGKVDDGFKRDSSLKSTNTFEGGDPLPQFPAVLIGQL